MKDEQGCLGEAFRRMMEEEEKITRRVDPDGAEWRKVYVGGGEHFKNWLEQCRELGEVMVEEIEPFGHECFGQDREKPRRIWVKVGEELEPGREPASHGKKDAERRGP